MTHQAIITLHYKHICGRNIKQTGTAMDQNTATAITHLKSLQDQQQNETLSSIQKHYEGKLWHQLTHDILELISSNDGYEMNFLDFYRNVVHGIENKLNIVSLSRIVCGVGKKLQNSGDTLAAVTFVQDFLDQRKDISPASTVYLTSHVCLFQMQGLLDNTEDPAASKSILDQVNDSLRETKKVLTVTDTEPTKKSNEVTRTLTSVIPTATNGSDAALVHAAYHEASMLYRKHVGPPEAFYTEALEYLNYAVPNEISQPYQLAIDLSLAALTGDGIFNFGQVTTNITLLQEQFSSENEFSWLMELLLACARGDIQQFIDITNRPAVQTAIQAQPALVARADVIKEKITLLSLVHMVFERPSQQRTLSFEDICEATKIANIAAVESLVMRALSLGLIRGVMDEVAQEVTVHWVMPRVLDKKQLKGLAGRFGEWAVQSGKVGEYVGEHVAV